MDVPSPREDKAFPCLRLPRVAKAEGYRMDATGARSGFAHESYREPNRHAIHASLREFHGFGFCHAPTARPIARCT